MQLSFWSIFVIALCFCKLSLTIHNRGLRVRALNPAEMLPFSPLEFVRWWVSRGSIPSGHDFNFWQSEAFRWTRAPNLRYSRRRKWHNILNGLQKIFDSLLLRVVVTPQNSLLPRAVQEQPNPFQAAGAEDIQGPQYRQAPEWYATAHIHIYSTYQ